MLKQIYLKENEWNYAIAQCYYEEYYHDYLAHCGCKPSFTFSDIEYFTVENRNDGLTEIIFYNKNNEYLFSVLD